MKTRIISGLVLGIIFAGVLAGGFWVSPLFVLVAVAIISAVAMHELLHTAAGINNKVALTGAEFYAALMALCPAFFSAVNDKTIRLCLLLSILYAVFAACMVLKCHREFDLARLMTFFAAPVLYSFAFLCLEGIIIHKHGIYYLLLLVNVSCVCDMGAYFVGSFLGKHKLCPGISPKKTVEGAVGGIVSSLIFTLILALCFGKSLWQPLLFTLPLCVLGMVGDLFASAIKRTMNLKDYGNLIPGHGGILDRFDSILMTAPLMWIIAGYGLL